MQRDWERREAEVIPDARAVGVALELAGFEGVVRSVEALSGGLSNSNLKVGFDGERPPIVLRLYHHAPEVLLKEAAAVELVSEVVPVPRFLYTNPEGEHFGRPWAIVAFCEGERVDDLLLSGDGDTIEGLGQALGAIRARLDAFCFDSSGRLGPGLAVIEPFGSLGASLSGWFESCLGEGGRAGGRLGPEISERLLRFVNEGAEGLAAGIGGARLAHGDFKGCNILAARSQGTWAITALLDWEFVFAGPTLFDVGQIMRYDCRLPPSFAESFERGYAEGGYRLPSDWMRLCKHLDLVNLCTFIDSPEARPKVFAEVQGLIEDTLRRFA